MPGEQSGRRRGVFLVLTATVLWSTGGLLARVLAPLDVRTVVGRRAALGAVSISIVGLVEWRRGEAIDRRTLIASIVALSGVIFVDGLGAGRLVGQAWSTVGTVAFAGMMVLQRRRPKVSRIAVNATGAPGLSLSPRPLVGPFDFAALFAYGLTTIGLAFVLFMEGAKRIPPAEAGLISLLAVVLGPIWVFLAFGENPGPMTLIGGAIVLSAVAHGASERR